MVALHRQCDSKYNHILMNGIVYMGLPKDFTEENILNLDGPTIEYCSLFPALMTLDLNERMDILSALEDCKKNTSKSRFNTFYWDILVDFILFYYGRSLYGIAGDLVNYYNFDHDRQKDIYNTLSKIKEIKLSPRKETQDMINTLLEIYGISGDILKTGKGRWAAQFENETYFLNLQIAVTEKDVDSVLFKFISSYIEKRKRR